MLKAVNVFIVKTTLRCHIIVESHLGSELLFRINLSSWTEICKAQKKIPCVLVFTYYRVDKNSDNLQCKEITGSLRKKTGLQS